VTARPDFTEEEWLRLGRAPLVVAMAISLSDPGGPIEVLKESGAALKVIVEAAQSGSYGPFVTEVARDVAEKTQRRENPLGGFNPGRTDAATRVLDELRGVEAILVAKADDEDADAYREWLRIAAQRSALAAREGGFLGFGSELVSEREQQMLDRLAEVFYTD
jgi:hypothetical protein